MGVNWGNGGFAPKNQGKTKSFRQSMADARTQLDEAAALTAKYQKIEPLLREALFKACASKEAITVISSFQILDDVAPGRKDDDDGFYKSANSAKMRFESGVRTIEAGTILTFSSFDRTTSSMIFKSAEGEEFAIYSTPMLAAPSRNNPHGVVRNEGYFGLLGKTTIMHDVLSKLKVEEGE